MVYLSEVNNLFWGVTLDGGKRYTQTAKDAFHISMAALEPGTIKDGEQSWVSVMIQHKDNAEFLLCTLDKNGTMQQPLDLNFNEGEELTFFLNGKGVVHLTGYIMEDDDLDEDDFDQQDSDEEGQEVVPRKRVRAMDSDSDEELDYMTAKRLKRQILEKRRRQLAGDSDEEDSEDEEEDSDEFDDDFLEDDFDEDDDDEEDDEDEEDEDGFNTTDFLDDEAEEGEESEEESDDEEDEELMARMGGGVTSSKPSKKAPTPAKQTPSKKNKGLPNGKASIEKKLTNGQTPGKTPKKDKTPGKTNKTPGKSDKTPAKNDKTQGKSEDTPTKSKKTPQTPKSGQNAPSTPDMTESSKKKKKQQKLMESQVSDSAQDSPSVTESAKKKKKKQKQQAEQQNNAQSPKPNQTPQKASKKTVEGGVVLEEIKEGHGPPAKPGKTVSVYYTGKLSNGKIFDMTTKGTPFKFKLGKNEVIRGWDVGLEGMKVGSRRRLTIPPKMAYGSQRMGEIPANSTLSFEVELKAVS